MRKEIQPPTVDDAQRILDRARIELRKARGNRLKQREAAEKGWLAARTAAASVLACAGEDWKRGGKLPERVDAVERKLDPRSQSFTSALYRTQSSLHGACFYLGYDDACAPRAIRSCLEDVAQAFPRAKRLCTLARRRSNGQTRKRG